MESEPSANLVIPEHQLLRIIGRGSYGQVWLARNTMGNYRAVKIVFRKSFTSQRPFERELSGIRTFEPISRSHEGFVDVLQVGMNDAQGYFYYIMEIGDDEISGQKIDPDKYSPRTLGSQISPDGKFPLAACLRLGLAITDALAELHRHELVHRDIKPSNIIFVNGVPKLADIGLVAGVKEARSYVGTEGFIPPEGPGTPQADLYSLGKVLYEVSTGKDRHEFPILPAHWSQSPEYAGLLELNEVILHSCNQDPARRYTSAWEMHGELLVVLNGKSVRRLRILERRLANLKRAGSATAAILVIAAAILYNVYREWRVAADERQRQVSANVAYGTRAVDSGDLIAGLPYFAKAFKLDQGKPDHEHSHRLRFGSLLAQCPKLNQIWFAPGRVNDGTFSPDGKSVLVAEFTNKASVFDLETGQMRGHSFSQGIKLRSAAYSPNGRWIVTTGESTNDPAILWDATSLENKGTLLHTDGVMRARFSPDSHKLLTAGIDFQVRIWNLDTREVEKVLPAGNAVATFAEFSHDGRLIATAGYEGVVRIWHSNGEPTSLVFRHSTWVTYLAFSPDDKRLVAACHDHKAHVWDLSSGQKIFRTLNHDDAVVSAEFSPDGRLILTGSFDNTARLWRASDLMPVESNPILRHARRLTRASFSPDGRLILTTSVDGTVRVWDLAGGEVPPAREARFFCKDGSRFLKITNNTLEVWDSLATQSAYPKIHPATPVQKAELNNDGRFILTTSQIPGADGTNYSLQLQVWDAVNGTATGPPILASNELAAATLDDLGRRLVTASSNMAQSWDVMTGNRISPPLVHAGTNSVSSAIFSPQGDFIVTTSETNAYIWETASGRQICPVLQLPVAIYRTEISRDGKYLLTGSRDTTLAACFGQVWDMRTGQPIGRHLWHGDGVLSCCFSRNARMVATAGEDYVAKIWETATGKEIGLPLKHQEHVWGVAFNSDAKWVVTASEDKTARIWDTQNTEPVTPPLHQLAYLVRAKFLPDGLHVLTTDVSGLSSIWPLRVDDRPASELSDFADFLSGGQLISSEEASGESIQTLKRLWEQLRAKYPEDFITTKEQIARWHDFRAEEAEMQEDWSAAAFHLERLCSLRPDDASASTRFSTARAHLNTAD